MITSAQEYFSRLQDIRNENLHKEVLQIPSDELIYAVDLNSRTIDTPVYLSTETDHTAETIFFIVDRYYETYDLAQSTCVIEYINAKNEPGIYLVPIYDLETYAEEGKMLIPWVIQGKVTKAAGTVKYAIRFYHLTKVERPEGMERGTEYVYDYIINTQVAQSKILKGMGETFIEDNNALDGVITTEGDPVTVDMWQKVYQDLTEMFRDPEEVDDPSYVRGALNLYWTVLD